MEVLCLVGTRNQSGPFPRHLQAECESSVLLHDAANNWGMFTNLATVPQSSFAENDRQEVKLIKALKMTIRSIFDVMLCGD